MNYINANIPTSIIEKLKISDLVLLGNCNDYNFDINLKGEQKKRSIHNFLLNYEKICINTQNNILARLIIRRNLRKIDLIRFKNNLIEMYKIIRVAKTVMNELGTSYNECVYQKAMLYELTLQGFKNPQTENNVQIYYPTKPFDMDNKTAHNKGLTCVGNARIDIGVGNWVLELKAIQSLKKKERGQLYKYLQHTSYDQGLIINFNQNTGDVDWTFQCEKKIGK
tara:strand:+ start:106 stop:777 length:672 start_codon:yes stop_codon:yes gene_type:complete